MDTKNILALDLGTKTGWASLCDGKRESGVVEFNLARGESVGMRYVLFNAWLDKMFGLIRPNIVICERPHHRGGYATELLVGFSTRVQEACERAKIDYTALHSATLKKFATGNGRASKEEMLDSAEAMWNGPCADHNEADALWLLEYARRTYLAPGGKPNASLEELKC